MAQADANISIQLPGGKRFRQWLIGAILVGGVLGIGVAGFSRGLFRWHQEAQKTPAPGPAPKDMVWIPAGTFWMGSDDFPDATPVHKVSVDGFWMDRNTVTNAQFRKFVEETSYKTVAEEAPNLENAAGSLIFVSPGKVPLDNHLRWWQWVPGACWRHPGGPRTDLQGLDQHPVVHVAYRDALAYCKWRSKKEGGTFRLPTEAEFEFAARGGLDRKTFVWGDDMNPDGKWMANTWQGDFPHNNTQKDGFAGTAPVGSFPANKHGLHDMAGNVWQWCADWYRADYYDKSPTRNPRGPTSSLDPQEPGVPKRVHRGGSFLCSDEYCKRYVSGARGKGEPDSATNHLGFRTVKSAE